MQDRIKDLLDWWLELGTGMKIATVWLSIVALALLILAIIFPPVGLLMLIGGGFAATLICIFYVMYNIS
jgi:uncharacterized membrane protein YqaE (UPF0057 family)